jgi:hypothetical protein
VPDDKNEQKPFDLSALPMPPVRPDLVLRKTLGYAFEAEDFFGAPEFNWETPFAGFMGMRLIIASWARIPAGSLPNDLRALHRLARYGTFKKFAKARDDILRGWTLHSDGLLYHRLVTIQAQRAQQAIDRIQARYRKSPYPPNIHRASGGDPADNVEF